MYTNSDFTSFVLAEKKRRDGDRIKTKRTLIRKKLSLIAWRSFPVQTGSREIFFKVFTLPRYLPPKEVNLEKKEKEKARQ